MQEEGEGSCILMKSCEHGGSLWGWMIIIAHIMCQTLCLALSAKEKDKSFVLKDPQGSLSWNFSSL
jgi:hypothetical protein